MTAGNRMTPPEQRRFTRIAHGGAVKYRIQGDDHLQALCLDIGWGGAALRLGRYLRPGTTLDLLFHKTVDSADVVRGRLVWCRPISGKSEFLAGIEANLDHGESVFSLSSVLLRTVSGAEAPVAECSAANQESTPGAFAWNLTRAAC